MSKILQSYLRFWAKQYLKRVKPEIIAVTGSVGKTSTKEAIFEVLKIHFGEAVRKSCGNLNTKNGVALSILGFQKSPEKFYQWFWPIKLAPFKALFGKKIKILVLEIAADHPGDIKYITSFVRPKISVLTSLGQAHLELFGSLEKIIEEKTEILRALPNDGWAVLNIDDENIKKLSHGGGYQVRTFGLEVGAEISAHNITTEIINFQPESKFQIITPTDKFLAKTKTLGRLINIYPALAACAVGKIFDLKQEEIIAGISNIRTQKHRLEIVKGKNRSTIIDDTYNANPLSMKAALDVLRILPARRKIAVLGDMLEIGQIAVEAHQLIGEYAAEIADEVIAIGDLAKNYQGQAFPNKEEAINYLLSKISENDMILIKASNSMGFVEIVNKLKE